MQILASVTGLVLLGGAGLGLWASGSLVPAYFRMTSAAPPAQVVLQPGLSADIQNQPIDGLDRNMSGLTYSDASDSLFGVINDPPAIVELSTDGRLLRRIPVTGAQDPEGITHVEGGTFILSDEGDQSLNWVALTPQTTTVALRSGPFIALGIDALHNMGFEGLSWDSRNQRLFVVQEMLPARVLVIDGLSRAVSGPGMGIEVREWPLSFGDGLMLMDLSSVTFNEATGNLLLLSHMSAMVAEFTPEGMAIGHMSLQGGEHGLSAGVGQAEGIAVDPQGTVYVVSEPNLFYRFRPGPGLRP